MNINSGLKILVYIHVYIYMFMYIIDVYNICMNICT